MKNIITTSMVLLSFAALQAQTDVVLTVDDTNNKTKKKMKMKVKEKQKKTMMTTILFNPW